MSDLLRRMEGEDESESLLARFEREDAEMFRPIVKMEPASGAEPIPGHQPDLFGWRGSCCRLCLRAARAAYEAKR